jgi:hypothetical protein
MGVKSLAESIILQSMEDLSDASHRAESLEFFSGEGFRICAQMAGMEADDQVKILELVRNISSIPCSAPENEKFRARARKFSVPALYG